MGSFFCAIVWMAIGLFSFSPFADPNCGTMKNSRNNLKEPIISGHNFLSTVGSVFHLILGKIRLNESDKSHNFVRPGDGFSIGTKKQMIDAIQSWRTVI
jgi:nitric oxide reductase large subunit